MSERAACFQIACRRDGGNTPLLADRGLPPLGQESAQEYPGTHATLVAFAGAVVTRTLIFFSVSAPPVSDNVRRS